MIEHHAVSEYPLGGVDHEGLQGDVRQRVTIASQVRSVLQLNVNVASNNVDRSNIIVALSKYIDNRVSILA